MDNTRENREKLYDDAAFLIRLAKEKIDQVNQMRLEAKVADSNMRALELINNILLRPRDW